MRLPADEEFTIRSSLARWPCLVCLYEFDLFASKRLTCLHSPSTPKQPYIQLPNGQTPTPTHNTALINIAAITIIMQTSTQDTKRLSSASIE